MVELAPLAKRDLLKPLSLKKLIGPSFILLGLGLGSGELILWLNLTNLDKLLRPSLLRVFWVSGAFLFYGVFSTFTLIQNLPK